jgi:RsiW-degrading membrane proteinase PrsW (M82 family)
MSRLHLHLRGLRGMLFNLVLLAVGRMDVLHIVVCAIFPSFYFLFIYFIYFDSVGPMNDVHIVVSAMLSMCVLFYQMVRRPLCGCVGVW